ncbi:MAG: 2-methylcitrate dehydratase PrpD [Gammaproteobacteria bacterium]|jgi:2-methylcitrate dehydratase PrpD
MTRDSAATQITAFSQRLREDTLPESIGELAKLHFLDALGVALAAASLATRPRIERAVAIMGSAHDSTALGCREAKPAPAAALLNGSLIHALEFDDTHMGAVVHASAVVAPVALALAEREHCTGVDLLKAFTLGWEILARAGQASPAGFHARGFQSTAVLGAPVAAAVAAWLMRLEPDHTVHAMGIAGSQASGIFEFVSDGSTVKMLHGGWPAHAGIMAAALASEGISGPATVFEGARGLYRAFTDDEHAGERFLRSLDTLGQRWLLSEVAFKAYPCCHYIQGALEALQSILNKGVSAREIERIDCQLPQQVAWLVCEPWSEKLAPPSGHVAKFSLPYCLAALLVDGRVDVSTFDRHQADPRLTSVMQRIHFQAMARSDFPARYPASVQVHTCREIHQAQVLDVHGSAHRAFSRDEVVAKFRANATRTLTGHAVSAVIDCVDRLDEAATLADLSLALRDVSAGRFE